MRAVVFENQIQLHKIFYDNNLVKVYDYKTLNAIDEFRAHGILSN